MTIAASHEQDIFSRILDGLCKNIPTPARFAGEQPLRAEFYSAEQMRQNGKYLAGQHRFKTEKHHCRLLDRLAGNETLLLAIHDLLNETPASGKKREPASDWLLDNFYLIEENIQTAKRHLPPGYSHRLPYLTGGTWVGYPRVYDIAFETIAHGDGQVNLENLHALVSAYQAINPLNLGELWAIPIMLRLALIENIRRLAATLAANRMARNIADEWADRMTKDIAQAPGNLILTIADMARSEPPMTSSFVATLTRRLQSQDSALTLPFTWLEQWLSDADLNMEQLIGEDIQQQAADQISMSNSVDGLRHLNTIDWREFIEGTSIVEQVLKEDPGGFYGKMDFGTRDRYRHLVEKVARRNPENSEANVARAAVKLAQESVAAGGAPHMGHVGYYLIDAGRTKLEHYLGLRASPVDKWKKFSRRVMLLLYCGSILLVMALCAIYCVGVAYGSGLCGWSLVTLGILAALGTCNLAVAMVNCPAMWLVPPKYLPRMDFSKGIPRELRTLVVVPTFLTGRKSIDAQLQSLEVGFLANRDARLHFGLLTDFRDAATETLPDDERLLQLARRGIEELNRKYCRQKNDLFFLFHRPRLWNAHDKIWMGRERKRGKLADLNRLLKGKSDTGFSLVVGNLPILREIKYVVTLDADTQLGRESVRQFVGTMAHPLNRPRYDEKRRRVVGGYGILQPRVTLSLTGMNRSLYSRMYTNEWGIDPYTRSVSDVYQDLFGEGSFIGKGIYDVDVFDSILDGRFPDNRILSHDLLEGCYARSGLLSDIPLYEEYPDCYSSDVSRRRRWIRGDWQVARWIMPRVPEADGTLRKNPLSWLSRWKLVDNLLRSLAPAALFALLFMGWVLLPFPWLWTGAIVVIIAMPALMAALLNVFQKSVDMTWRQHFAGAGDSMFRRFLLAAFSFICLPYEAFFSLDAIVRAVWRLRVSHRKLLEWNPSDQVRNASGKGLIRTVRSMWIVPCVSVASLILFALLRPELLATAGPVLVLWLAAPVVVWRLGLPIPRKRENLSPKQIRFLRRTARKTWTFFAAYTGPEDHWLPPDNVQMEPDAAVAHRTSPTNMGLALLANLSAYDFGTISAGQLLDRTANTLESMKKLERCNGHFYNWYDTKSLTPLHPRYVSSVDSGNLAGHLHVLRVGLLELADRKIIGESCFESLADTLDILIDAAALSPGTCNLEKLRELRSAPCLSGQPHPTISAVRNALEQLNASAAAVLADIGGGSDPESPVRYWGQALSDQCADVLHELKRLSPWLDHPACFQMLKEFPMLDRIPSLREISGLETALDLALAQTLHHETVLPGGLRHHVAAAAQYAANRMAVIRHLAGECDMLAQMDYEFLYDKSRRLLSIGYNADESKLDSNYYDLLASEARLTSFVAIAQGRVPQESWFALGRLLTIVDGEPILLSWSGSMFEYLMPLLVMPSYERTLLADSCRAAVDIQISYGSRRRVPWGISECGYHAIDTQRNYQYRAFGVPGLGLKRGLADDLVIAPYASMLALMVSPREACLNLERLADSGIEGKYGFYEAVDYTPSHLPHGQTQAVVRSFMVHHQGMGLLALESLLLDRPMQKRFTADLEFRAALMLLQERIPKAAAFYAFTTEIPENQPVREAETGVSRSFNSPDTPTPEVHLLSNGRYHVMITNSGGGYSRWNNLAVTRWNEDPVCDGNGSFCFIRDVATGEFRSAIHQPMCRRPDDFKAVFSAGRAEFRRTDGDCETLTEIAVSPEDDIELRRIRITNRTESTRTLDVTSYAEAVLAESAADAMHPAFSNLFIQTEIVASQNAILCTRRPRAANERHPWLFHLMAIHGAEHGSVSAETDRRRFIGRGNTIADPAAVSGGPDGYADYLSGSEGPVLDPVVSLRSRVTLAPGETVTVNLFTGVAETRETALLLVEKYQDKQLSNRVFDLAWTHEQVLLRQLNASESDIQLYLRLAGSILYANPALRAPSKVILKNRRGQSGLWGYAISGDLPIVLLRIKSPDHIELARQLIQAHAYWRLKGLSVDLVIWNEDNAGYRQLLHDQIAGLIASGTEANIADRAGGIFLRNSGQISEEDRILIQTVARVILSDRRGTLAEQIAGRVSSEIRIPLLRPRGIADVAMAPDSLPEPPPPLFYNGLGGFTADGREYVIHTASGQSTPAPWINILANPDFGSFISESGQSCTWSRNAHEFRLTPWENDPVSDTGGEAFYLRDEETGAYWSPMPFPCGGATPGTVRHGFGYSVFEHLEHGIHSETWVYTAIDAAVKFTAIRIRNESARPRSLSVTGYVEWILGDLRAKTAMHVTTETDRVTGAVFARNRYHAEFRHETAFFDVDQPVRTITGDRLEFLGRNGSLRSPSAMKRTKLSGKVGASWSPCAAIRVNLELGPGEEREIVFRLGAGLNTGDTVKLVKRFRGSVAPREALEAVMRHWIRTLGAIQVETPDPAVNVMANGWLLYQTLACRLWARNAKYQSGGAFGFRDQLQDVLALVYAGPELVRAHLLLAAAHQFQEGDVQHWWHPPVGRGVRTHCSDDYLWLPFAVCRYVRTTGDTGVLEENVRFLKGRPVKSEEDSYYDLPSASDEVASLYDHCVRSIRYGLKFGAHGLPLMGSGDWNDGMNLVGERGRGESVWLAFFLYDVLEKFSRIALACKDTGFAGICIGEAEKLRKNIEKSGWDGEWYRRAYFDDGSPLGSSESPECRIDSIAQSWSILSGAGSTERSGTAMNSFYENLVCPADRIVKLLTPPFDRSSLNPGYIKGYVPGVRENGGQYTHAAIWAAMAFAKTGDGRRAWELLDMINPVNHAKSPGDAAVYQVEPYVVAADVYAVAPHVGQGGWTWYSGAAGWMYQLMIDSLLGFSLEVDKLRFHPCLPDEWNEFKLHYRYRETVYHIQVVRIPGRQGEATVTVDGVGQRDQAIPLVNDHLEHHVEITIMEGT